MNFDHIRAREQQRHLRNMRVIRLSCKAAMMQGGFEELFEQTQEQRELVKGTNEYNTQKKF